LLLNPLAVSKPKGDDHMKRGRSLAYANSLLQHNKGLWKVISFIPNFLEVGVGTLGTSGLLYEILSSLNEGTAPVILPVSKFCGAIRADFLASIFTDSANPKSVSVIVISYITYFAKGDDQRCVF